MKAKSKSNIFRTMATLVNVGLMPSQIPQTDLSRTKAGVLVEDILSQGYPVSKDRSGNAARFKRAATKRKNIRLHKRSRK